jgi:Ca2+-binding EF-hand superfamily protein
VQDIEGQLLLEKFREFDTDQTGYIDGTELAALVKSVGVTLEGHQLQRAFAQMDKEGDNRIQFEEFLAWYRTTNAGEEAE